MGWIMPKKTISRYFPVLTPPAERTACAGCGCQLWESRRPLSRPRSGRSDAAPPAWAPPWRPATRSRSSWPSTPRTLSTRTHSVRLFCQYSLKGLSREIYLGKIYRTRPSYKGRGRFLNFCQIHLVRQSLWKKILFSNIRKGIHFSRDILIGQNLYLKS